MLNSFMIRSMAGAGNFPWVFSQRPLCSRGLENMEDVFDWLLGNMDFPCPHFRKHLIYTIQWYHFLHGLFLLKLLDFNLPEPLRFERVGGVLQRSWILGIIISSEFLFHRHFCFGVSGVFLNSRDSPIATISQVSWLLYQSPPTHPPHLIRV